MILHGLREGGSNIERSGGALGHGSELQETRTAVGSRRLRPGCNELVGRYVQDENGGGISPLRPGYERARGRGSPPSRLPACFLLSPLPTLAVTSGMAGMIVVVIAFVFVFQLADVDMDLVVFAGGLHIGSFLFVAMR